MSRMFWVPMELGDLENVDIDSVPPSDGQSLVWDASSSAWEPGNPSAPAFVGVSLRRTTTQSIPNNTQTAVSFDTEGWDTDAFHSTGTNPTRITVPTGKAGKYLVTGWAHFAANTTGKRGIQFLVNGTAASAQNGVYPTQGVGDEASLELTAVLDLAVGDYIEMAVFQNSGGALNLNTGGAHPKFQASLLGA